MEELIKSGLMIFGFTFCATLGACAAFCVLAGVLKLFDK